MILYLAAIMVGLSLSWMIYNMAALFVGYTRWNRKRHGNPSSAPPEDPPDDPPGNDPPRVSIILPAKNEERMIERTLEGLVSLDYPSYEILIVEDGSTDRTPQICRRYAREYSELVEYYHRDRSDGKPSAINFGARRADGEIIAIYDADTVIPDSSVLDRMVAHFRDPEVDAVQGELSLTNPREGLITRISDFVSTLRMIQQHGKDRLGLFVSLGGNHQYVRREVLEELGYWDPEALTEDIEISVRLSNENHKIEYVPVRARSEAPPTLGEYFKQRVRWFRGFLQTLAKHGRQVRGRWRRRYDVWGSLLSPSFSMIGLLGWVLAAVGFTFFDSGGLAAGVLWGFGMFFLILTLSALILITIRSPRNLIYIPVAYISWILESIISLYSHIAELLKRPRRWTKTGRKRGER